MEQGSPQRSPQRSPRQDSPDSATLDEEWQVPVSSPEASFVGDRWQPDAEVDGCAICNTKFSFTFRKHHCRQCLRVVCETCSPQRLRLLKLPKDGKVRVCDPCVKTLGAVQASGFEEDLAAYEESIRQLRFASRDIFEEKEIFKRVLLEMDAEASGNMSLMEEHFLDPETDLATFSVLKERVQLHWSGLLDARIQGSVHNKELVDRHLASVERVDEALASIEQLKLRKADLLADARLVDKMQAERDELARKELDLDKAITESQKRIRELEALQRGASPLVSAPGEPEAFTITAGQRLVNGPSRLEACTHSLRDRCVMM